MARNPVDSSPHWKIPIPILDMSRHECDLANRVLRFLRKESLGRLSAKVASPSCQMVCGATRQLWLRPLLLLARLGPHSSTPCLTSPCFPNGHAEA
jgi:hypothetical protein